MLQLDGDLRGVEIAAAGGRDDAAATRGGIAAHLSGL